MSSWKKIYADIEANIEKHGLTVIGVFADPVGMKPTFSYSIGLTDRGWPEMIMVGLHAPYAKGFINALARRPEPPKIGEQIDDLADLPIRIGAVSEEAIKAYMVQSTARQERTDGPRPTAVQVIYPDKDGRFPGEPGYDLDPRTQPLLAPTAN